MTPAAADILNQARTLSVSEKAALGVELLKEAAEARAGEISVTERDEINHVLLDRASGPFEAFPPNWKGEVIELAAASHCGTLKLFVAEDQH